MTDELQLEQATFEAMVVGETLGPTEAVVDDHYIKQAAFAVDDYNPWYFNPENPFETRVAPAAALLADLLRLLNTRFDPNTEAGLHQKEEVWITAPARIGERVVMRGRFVDKYTKRGKGYVVTEAEARGDDGRLILRHRATEIARIEPGTELGTASAAPSVDRRVEGIFPAGVDPITSLSASVVPGQPLLGPLKTIHQDQMSVFSNVGSFWFTIHTDQRAARRAGLETTLAQGLMESLYLSEFGTQLFGASWFETGWMLTSYLQPVLAGDVLQVKGVVSECSAVEGGSGIEVETWLENQRGQKTAVGWLRGTLPTP